MYRRIPITVVFLTIGLLLGIFCASISADDNPYSEEELSKLSNNKFQLINGVGVHIFNLNEQGHFESEGCISLSNTYDKPVSVKLEVIIEQLSTVDLDDEGNPRIHKTISDSIYIHPFPKSWITLSEDEIVIPANSWYNVYYTVDIPYEDAWKYIEQNTSNGFLGYVNIRKGLDIADGMNIGINYNYKIFSLFSGDYQESTMGFYFFAGITAIIGGLVLHLVYNKVEKRKRLDD